jgi:transposase
VLIRRLQGRPPVTDVFGVRGRRWLSELELPEDERETIAGCLRHVDFLDAEVAALDRAIASEALRHPDVLRLMTVPGAKAAARWRHGKGCARASARLGHGTRLGHRTIADGRDLAGRHASTGS